MLLTRFRDMAEAYGGDLARWPDDAQRPARLLLQAEPEAARILAEAARQDGLLSGFPAPQPSARLREALVAAAPKPRAAGRLRLGWLRLFLPASGLAAAGLAGAIVGAALYSHAADAAQTDALVDSALIESNTVDELSAPLTISSAAPEGRA